jgi:hypothetical protein
MVSAIAVPLFLRTAYQTFFLCGRNSATPQVYITKGLRGAVCDLMVKESVSKTQEEIERRSGAKGLLSRRSVLNILHREGAALIKAQEERARAIFEATPEAKGLIVVSKNNKRKRAAAADWDGESESESEQEGRRVIWNWEEGEIKYKEKRQRTQAEGLIIVQMDEVKVEAQPHTMRKELWIYTGVVRVRL